MAHKLNEKTEVPLWSVIAATFGILPGLIGITLYVTGIAGSVSLAQAKNTEQDNRMDRQMQEMRTQREMIIETNTRTARIEAMVEVIMTNTKRQ